MRSSVSTTAAATALLVVGVFVGVTAPPASAAACRPSTSVLPLPDGATQGTVTAGVPGLAVGTVIVETSTRLATRWVRSHGTWRLRPLPGLPDTDSQATGLSAAGDVSLTFGPQVGTTIDPADPPTAAVLSGVALYVLSDGIGGTAAFTTGINDHGQVVGAAMVRGATPGSAPVQAAVRWDDWTAPPVVLAADRSHPSVASGIDDAGAVAGTVGDLTVTDSAARRWDASGAAQALEGGGPGRPTFANDTNEGGRTVGFGAATAGGNRVSALVWDGDDLRVLPPIGRDDVTAAAVSVSPSGVVVGRSDRFGPSGSHVPRVLFWSGGRVRSLLPATGDWYDGAAATAIDSVGTVYGSSAVQTLGGLHPTVWTCAARQAFVPSPLQP